jgi:redox-regulated HSP33 family molecular chaperone
VNLFFTGSARELTVVGRAFHEHLAALGRSMFYAQTRWRGGETRTSSVDVEGTDIFGMVEQYAAKSEGVPARLFRKGGERVALIWPLPGADRGWIEGVRAEEVFAREESGGLKPIAGSPVSFRCGCDLARITKIVYELWKGDADEFFGGEPSVEAECPRCGTDHEISRESFERLRS